MINENTIKKLGHKVRIIRTDRGFSQEQLAEKADLNRSFVGLLERGKTNITIKNQKKKNKFLKSYFSNLKKN